MFTFSGLRHILHVRLETICPEELNTLSDTALDAKILLCELRENRILVTMRMNAPPLKWILISICS